MRWVEQAIGQFCQELGVPLPSPPDRVIQLQFEHSGIVQLEQHSEQLTVWLALDAPWHQTQTCLQRAMSASFSEQTGELPLRCGWLGEQQLLLLVTLEQPQVTAALLHQTLQTLLRVRQQVLEP